MNGISSDLADILHRCQAGIAMTLRQAAPQAEQASKVAELLHELTPQAALIVCLLRGEGADALAIRPPSESSTDTENALRPHLASCDPLALGVQKLRHSSPRDLHLLIAAIHESKRALGYLLLGIPTDTAAEVIAQAEVLLTVAAPLTALHATFEALHREQTELARFALVGQAFAGLAHDLNNALNSMMLQTSVVQLKVDEQARNDLTAIRQHGAQAAGLVRSLQHIVQERREKFYAVNLNNVLADVLEENTPWRDRVSLQLSPEALHIHSTRSAVKQLVRLLLEGACAAAAGTIHVATEKRDDGAVLCLTLAASVPSESAEGEPPTVEDLLWQNLDEVGRQAGKSLIRQLSGSLTMDRRNDGSLLVCVHWEKSS